MQPTHTPQRNTVSLEQENRCSVWREPHSIYFLWLRGFSTRGVFIQSLEIGGWWLWIPLPLRAVSDPISKVYGKSKGIPDAKLGPGHRGQLHHQVDSHKDAQCRKLKVIFDTCFFITKKPALPQTSSQSQAWPI